MVEWRTVASGVLWRGSQPTTLGVPVESLASDLQQGVANIMLCVALAHCTLNKCHNSFRGRGTGSVNVYFAWQMEGFGRVILVLHAPHWCAQKLQKLHEP